MVSNIGSDPRTETKTAGGSIDVEIEQLIKKLSSSEVLERGESLNKAFNDFSIGELLKPFNI
ncbi:MAG: hypothetical protein U9N40_04290 [Euryarchaeota archaeon]|nr:hypothetical protein [Euryarchaeota archaeon]